MKIFLFAVSLVFLTAYSAHAGNEDLASPGDNPLPDTVQVLEPNAGAKAVVPAPPRWPPDFAVAAAAILSVEGHVEDTYKINKTAYVGNSVGSTVKIWVTGNTESITVKTDANGRFSAKVPVNNPNTTLAYQAHRVDEDEEDGVPCIVPWNGIAWQTFTKGVATDPKGSVKITLTAPPYWPAQRCP